MHPADSCQNLCVFAHECTRVFEGSLSISPKVPKPDESPSARSCLVRLEGGTGSRLGCSPGDLPTTPHVGPCCPVHGDPWPVPGGEQGKEGGSDPSGQGPGSQALDSPSNSRRDKRKPLDGLSLYFPICEMSCRLNGISGSQPGHKPESSN